MSLAEWWSWFGPGWTALAAAAVALSLPGVLWWAAGRGLTAVVVPQTALTGAALGVLVGLTHGLIALPAAAMAVVGGLVVRPVPAALLLGAGTALPVVLVSGSPHGMQEVTDLTLSRILGLTWTGAWPSLAVAACGLVAMAVTRRHLLAAVLDPVWAASAGLRPRLVLVGLGAWGGVVVGVAMPAIGLIGVIGFLLLPALAARAAARRLGQQVVLAPLMALVSVGLSIPVAHLLDAPPVPTAVLVQALVVGLAWLVKGCAGR